jgi:hypothetical protein
MSGEPDRSFRATPRRGLSQSLAAWLHRVLALLVTMTFSLPFFVIGIVATMILVMQLLGIGPHDKSWAALGLFTLLVPVGTLASGLVGYALLLVLLRATKLEHWYEQQTPARKPSWMDLPYAWVRSGVDRLVPGRSNDG